MKEVTTDAPDFVADQPRGLKMRGAWRKRRRPFIRRENLALSRIMSVGSIGALREAFFTTLTLCPGVHWNKSDTVAQLHGNDLQRSLQLIFKRRNKRLRYHLGTP